MIIQPMIPSGYRILVIIFYSFFWYHYLEHSNMLLPSEVMGTKSDKLGLGMRQGEMIADHP